MRTSIGMSVTALLASAFTTTAWAQGLCRVNFETSCTPQAQERFDRGLAMVHSFFYPDSVQPLPTPLPPTRNARSRTGASRSAIAPTQ